MRNLSATMLFVDPPQHGYLRSAIQPFFGPQVLNELRAYAERITFDLAHTLVGIGPFDFLHHFASRIPLLIVGKLIGIPPRSVGILKQINNRIVAALGSESPSEERLRIAELAIRRRNRLLTSLLRRRKRVPENDLTTLLGTRAAQFDLSEEQCCATLGLIFAAAHETTSNLIANTLLLLLRNPAQMQEVRRRRELLPEAVEESLRLESPVQWNPRIAADDFVLENSSIRKGQTVLIGRGAANRDPSRFEAPAEFIISRRTNAHLSFGTGRHMCPGASLARMQARVALGCVLEVAENIQLNQSVIEWEPDVAARALKRLVVTWQAR
jgi:cytochrome P450